MDSPKKPVVSSATPIPICFYNQEFWGFIFLALEPWVMRSDLELGSVAPKVSLPNFVHHMQALRLPTPPLHAKLHLLTSPPQLCTSTTPTCLDEFCFFNWLLDFHTIWFSGSSKCICFEVSCILSVVVRWGKACLHMPLSWLEVLHYLFKFRLCQT